ncbi:hypothetical protein B0T19DRAFT_456757 [Cercophora scortea]|uniref:Zn(2)-C6 fungal-type domain-containing protein n=1 Tax=Cercophora scortea TaxID=314031 RepID=A0AAE0IWD6_9PEZI|nr:hypothetical protein B0T19DRAFT_456757 [Cercophora scortea]
MPRRKHTKSRRGCAECKRRHMKCDERHPVCIGCSLAGLNCPFSSSAPSLPLPSTTTTSRSSLVPSSTTTTTASSLSSDDSPYQRHNFNDYVISPETSTPSSSSNFQITTTTPITSSQPPLTVEHYSLQHFTLLHEFPTLWSTTMGLSPPDAERFIQLATKEAYTTPFLMDELLALLSAHRSTLPDEPHAAWYRTEATRLQTRALGHFNARTASVCNDDDDDDCLAVFLFSALLGQHVLFEAFSLHVQGNLEALLDKFVQCLSLHRGIAAIAGRSWSTLQTLMPFGRFGTHTRESILQAAPAEGTECDGLLQRLAGSSQLSAPSRQACCAAVEVLQGMFDAQRAPEPELRRIVAVQEWSVRVSGEYIGLLARRQPEALVVLAYYSVLLYRARDYWAVGNAGEFIIRSVGEYLGVEWEEWLAWPQYVLHVSAVGVGTPYE